MLLDHTAGFARCYAESMRAMNENGVENQKALPPTPLGRVLLSGIRTGWDRIGLMVAISLTWTLLFFLALTLAQWLLWKLPFAPAILLGLLCIVTLLAGPTGGAYHTAQCITVGENVVFLEFCQHSLRLWKRMFTLGLIHLVIGVIFAVNIRFYIGVGGIIGIAVSILCLYALLFWMMMALYHVPLLMAEEAGVFTDGTQQTARGIQPLLRRAFYLALGSPFYTLGLLAALLLLSALMFATGVLAAMLWAGLIPLLSAHATRAQLIRYGLVSMPVTEEVIPDEQFRLPLNTERRRE